MSATPPATGSNPADWKAALLAAERRAVAAVHGASRIKHVHHARLVTVALEAFGADPRATLYIEGLTPRGKIPRPDLILLHPDIGVMVIENKGLRAADIHRVEESTLWVVRDGQLKDEDPFEQAERVMYRLKDLVAPRIDAAEAMYLRTAALPRIGRGEFERQFKRAWPDETLFAEECATGEAFRRHLLGYAAAERRRWGRGVGLTNRASEAVMNVLSGKAFLYTPRRPPAEGADPALLGTQIQSLELGLKHATAQQKALGTADFRGGHRLFRGVAGSGKSVLLALSAAATLTRFREEGETLFEAAGPPKRVLVACFNKSLVPYLKGKIDDRFGRLAWDKPDAASLTVCHVERVIQTLEGAEPALKTGLNFYKKPERAKLMAAALDALPDDRRHALGYDAVYIDEAQDLEPDEIRLLLRLARPDPKTGLGTFVVFYDNAQNIYGVRTPVWQDLGVHIVGRTDFLDLCLRNTAQTLDFALNVLVGTDAAEGLRVATRQFADLQSLRERKLIDEPGGAAGRIIPKFAPRTGSPPVVTVYSDRAAEVAGVAGVVRSMVHQQKVEPSDILVLARSFKDYGGLDATLQRAVGPKILVRRVDPKNQQNKLLPLLEEGVLTLSTIYSAKGYDAPVVIVLGADVFDAAKIEDRALFYVAATRAKLLLHVTAAKAPAGPAQPLLPEIERAAAAVSGGTPN